MTDNRDLLRQAIDAWGDRTYVVLRPHPSHAYLAAIKATEDNNGLD